MNEPLFAAFLQVPLKVVASLVVQTTIGTDKVTSICVVFNMLFEIKLGMEAFAAEFAHETGNASVFGDVPEHEVAFVKPLLAQVTFVWFFFGMNAAHVTPQCWRTHKPLVTIVTGVAFDS